MTFDEELTRPDLRAIIVAMTSDGVIGKDGQIPWKHTGDLARFKRLTMGSTIIMGRLTWESFGSKPLPGRRNVVVTQRSLDGADCYRTFGEALDSVNGPVWFIGGRRIYEAALLHANFVDITHVPDSVQGENLVKFPEFIAGGHWEIGPVEPHDNPALTVQRFRWR